MRRELGNAASGKLGHKSPGVRHRTLSCVRARCRSRSISIFRRNKRGIPKALGPEKLPDLECSFKAHHRHEPQFDRRGPWRRISRGFVLPHQHSHDRPTPTTRSCGDIRLFVDKFLGPGWEIAPDALERIVTYRWPGNIRQLINIIERAKILADDQVIVASDLPPELHAPPSGSIASADLTPVDNLQSLQKSKVVEILERVHGNRTRAARQLGITRRSLYRLLERYGPDDDATTDGTV